ncbi:MAG: DUF177 domain-containing protein [Ruminococcaceae bacterium]|nr:DUF177 domain-containing protein [Oscillospiraceae bacterium]MBQ9913572.1 DUF177 domain-containing protein [Clostridia bacterium]
MYIALESLFNGGVTKLPVDCEFDFSGEELDGVFPFTTPVSVKGEIKNMVGVVTIEAMAKFTLEVFCDRCAEPVSLDFGVPMVHGLVSSLNEDDNDDYILVEDMRLDLLQLTLEDIFLTLPSKFLCREDCKGVCTKCGANLNNDSCSCKKDIDPRLEALLGLLED